MTTTRRKVLNCFDRLWHLVGNRVPAHGSEAPYLVKLLESVVEEKRIASELLDSMTDPRVDAASELANGWINAAWIGDSDEGSPDQWRLLGGCGRDLLGVLKIGDKLVELDPDDDDDDLEAAAVGGHRDPIRED